MTKAVIMMTYRRQDNGASGYHDTMTVIMVTKGQA